MNAKYRSVPLTVNRRMVADVAAVAAERGTIHAITEVDITEPRRLIREHLRRTGERLSFTAYIVACLGRAVAEHPHVQAFRRGRKLITMEDVTVSAMVEREIRNEKVPEPLGIRAAQRKTYRQIHQEIRTAQAQRADHLGSFSGIGWVRLLPSFLLRSFMRLGSQSIRLNDRFGTVAVTAVGMFGKGGALWFLPVSSATLAVTVGGIVERPVLAGGAFEVREHLCLTLSFDHAIVDGAPAARFVGRLTELLASGDALRETGR